MGLGEAGLPRRVTTVGSVGGPGPEEEEEEEEEEGLLTNNE
jgi:hypothetical protein